MIVLFDNCSSFPILDASSGVRVKETNKLSKVAVTTTIEYSLIMFPISPPVNARGTNTETSTNVIASAAKPISFLPLSAATFFGSPFSR